ncbi:MAG: hypothetical protein KDC10_09365, partial [Calditrichaeota bacterium]|nr:hypothetical protein [Calditrichota bacterium]
MFLACSNRFSGLRALWHDLPTRRVMVGGRQTIACKWLRSLYASGTCATADGTGDLPLADPLDPV